MKNLAYKVGAFALASVGSLAALAEGETSGSEDLTLSTSAASSIMTAAETAVDAFIETATPILGGIVVAFGGFFLALVAWRLIKRFITRSA